MANGRPAKGPERFLTCGRETTALATGERPHENGTWNQHGPIVSN